MQKIVLNANWQMKQAESAPPDFNSGEWITANVPGTTYQDLLAAGKIPDPYYGMNENEVQWVGEADWLYRCAFDVPADTLDAPHVDLCFDGLDTFATVWLNGAQILASDNMFVPQRIAVKDHLKASGNQLAILFESAMRKGKEREAQYGQARLWNGDSSRVYVRKAQYHYGWDWGPCLLTAGIWREARLEAYDARIREIDCPVDVSVSLTQATLPAQIKIDGAGADNLRLTLYNPNDQIIVQTNVPVQGSTAAYTFTIQHPDLWWPNGHGKQPRYRLVAELQAKGETLDQVEQRLGLRRLRLAQEPVAGESGTSFVFEVNNKAIFCGGANWIPADNFLPRASDQQYRALLERAAEAHMTMLRVWGGGIYESDLFYDLCDELGLLVWQDFAFGCALYPALDWFMASVKAEAEANVRRLRHHASLALWCGNNEDYSIAQSLNLYHPEVPLDETVGADFSRFPARLIYEQLLPEVCAALDSTRPYWPGSPYSAADNGDVQDQTIGDRHTWDIWHGQSAKYQDYPRFGARFVSEFGMEAAPLLPTLEAVLPVDERSPQSRTFEFHNKASDGYRRLAVYIADNFQPTSDFARYIYTTQLVQAEALASALRGWRRRWNGQSNSPSAGALVWQINDCWPVTSWAMIDWYSRPKPSYYVVRRALAPLALELAYEHGHAAIWVVNDGAAFDATLLLDWWTLDGEKVLHAERVVQLNAARATELGAAEFDPLKTSVLSATLIAGGEIKARAALWPEPFKYLKLPDPEVRFTYQGNSVLLEAERPAKGVFVWTDGNVHWYDNMLDLMPDDPREIDALNLQRSDRFHVEYLHG